MSVRSTCPNVKIVTSQSQSSLSPQKSTLAVPGTSRRRPPSKFAAENVLWSRLSSVTT